MASSATRREQVSVIRGRDYVGFMGNGWDMQAGDYRRRIKREGTAASAGIMIPY